MKQTIFLLLIAMATVVFLVVISTNAKLRILSDQSVHTDLPHEVASLQNRSDAPTHMRAPVPPTVCGPGSPSAQPPSGGQTKPPHGSWEHAPHTKLATLGKRCTSTSPCFLVGCTAVWYEAPYLREWLAYHLMQGVDHFYLMNLWPRKSVFRDLQYRATAHAVQPFVDAGQVPPPPWPNYT